MRGDGGLVFKIAGEDREFEGVHRLNHRTFAQEIPQHAPNAEGRLVDKFHAENTYAVCLDGDEVVGMVAGRMKRPFSLDSKVPDLDSHLPPGRRPGEVRLLAVDPRHRRGFVFARLVGLITRHLRDQGCDLGIASGTTRQARLYRRMGFVPFGPLVGTGDAKFQPMYMTLERFVELEPALAPPPSATPRKANFTPGPVEIHDDVRAAFHRDPVSHRGAGFAADLRAARRMLCAMTGAARAEILLGSGTLANDVVAGQLLVSGDAGLVLANGEFGERLVDQATRMRLPFAAARVEWGATFDPDEIDRRLAADPRIRWLWTAHCETSTGVLNDVAAIAEVCARRDVRLCLDCISSVGTVPVDLAGVHLATCASGKGLAAFPGLSMVLHHHEVAPAPTALPRYLDLGFWAAEDGVPFTQSSNLVFALEAALARARPAERFARIAAAAAALRRGLRVAGFRIVADDAHASPAVTTVALPSDVDSADVGRRMEARGFALSCNSGYLKRRNWVQACLMGDWDDAALARLPSALAASCGDAGRQPFA
jgi:aspartate aminotransferase-like enzyme/GNAT superfamily N-acetyltransferase